MPLGGRVLVVADLLLGRTSTAASEVATAELAAALDGWDGPGVVVFAGDLFDLLGDEHATPSAGLAAHPRLAVALRAFLGRPARRAICLPGSRDARLAWDDRLAADLATGSGVEVAVAVDAVVATGEGERRVRIEAGNRFDERFAPADPPSPVDTPLGTHVITDLVPALDARWSSGADRLVDMAALPRFVASRLLYRRAGRWWWVLLVPFVLALAVKVPLSFALAGRLDRALGPWSDRLALGALTTAIDVAIVAGVLAALLSRGWRAVAGPARSLGLDDVARHEARQLIAAGYTGLVVGHTRTPELADLGRGFFAAAGAATELVEERRGRFGFPPVFVPVREIDWIEIEAGARLHARLLHSRIDAPGATVLERMVAPRLPATERPHLVGSWPGGDSWPEVEAPLHRLTRVRRRAAAAIAVAGVLNVASAITPPLEDRLQALLRFVPLAVPETATALVAMAGIGLLALSRGVRRGQRQAWRVALALLAGSIVLHVVKGADIEEAATALVAGAYLLVHRDAFGARIHSAQLRDGLVRVAVALPITVVGAVVAMEAVTAAEHRRLPLGQATIAVLERLVGVTTVALPVRLGEFADPTLLAVGVAFAAWLVWLAVRPAVARRTSGDEMTQARAIVRRWAAGTLDYFALRDDKELFLWGTTVVAYAVHHGVCLVSPDPIGPDWEREDAWTAFRRFTDLHGWSVAVLGAGESWLDTYRTSGMHHLYVGDEGVVDVRRFTLEGGRHKALRQAVNRIAKHGYTISFHDPSTASPELQAGVRAVMGKSRRGDVERGFSMTLGRIFDRADTGLLLAVCSAPSIDGRPGEPVAFCQYVPAPGIAGYSLDLMRRDDGEHPNGLLDFVIVETIRHLDDQGFERLGLNFATMRAVLAGESGAGIVGGIERWALRRMSGAMQIESLWRFNAKFDPEWAPRYLVHDSPEHLVPIAFAIARAESFWELPVIGRFLVPSDERTRPSGELAMESHQKR
ncbi:MAG: hypothetical protein JWN29_3674 [Acidimicrobiales bacterium]|nr:hypothetical protein [Acidimicrobiales bacterium]